MLGNRHVVVKGDNLWNIAKTYLGSGTQWPRIWRYNNRPDVIAVTGRGIKNPDLIYIGQVLLIPVIPGQQGAGGSGGSEPQDLAPAAPQTPAPQPSPLPSPSPQPVRSPGPLERQLPTIQSPVSLKFRLDDIRFPPVDTPLALVEFRITGDILLRSSKSYPATYVTSRREIEAQFTQELNHAFGKLIGDNRFIYDPGQKTVTVRSMLVSQSKTPNAPATAVGVEMSSNSPIPKLRAEIRFPKLEGSIDGIPYVAVDVKFVIEITPKAPPPVPSPQPIRVPHLAPAPAPQPVRVQEPGTNWPKVIGTGLVVVGTAIVVATVVEDFLTAGAGVADDPASFAAAGTAFARGIALIRGAALPQAMAPASVTVGAAVQLAH